MLRTSRCFAGTLLQLGGPDALSSVVRYPYQVQFADRSFARIAPFSRIKLFFTTWASSADAVCKLGPKLFATAKRTELFATPKPSAAQDLRGNLATPFVAIG